jgi:hypothetical protein
VIDEHAAGEGGFFLALDFDMDQYPGFRAISPPDLHQLVGQPPPQLGIADNLLQLLVQKDGGAAPVDFGVDLWKEEGEEVSQIGFEDVFPQLILGRSVQSTFS